VRAIWECDNLGPSEVDKGKFKFIVDTLKSVRHYSHLDHIVLQRLNEQDHAKQYVYAFIAGGCCSNEDQINNRKILSDIISVFVDNNKIS